MSRLFWLALVAALMTLPLANFARSDTIGGTCTANAIAFKMSDEGLTTTQTSSSPQVIPGAAIKFVQGGTQPGCVVVHFSSLASTNGNNASYIYFDLDGMQRNQLYADRLNVGQTGLFSAVYVFTAVSPGAHTLRMRLASSDGVAVGVALTRVLVHYRK